MDFVPASGTSEVAGAVARVGSPDPGSLYRIPVRTKFEQWSAPLIPPFDGHSGQRPVRPGFWFSGRREPKQRVAIDTESVIVVDEQDLVFDHMLLLLLALAPGSGRRRSNEAPEQGEDAKDDDGESRVEEGRQDEGIPKADQQEAQENAEDIHRQKIGAREIKGIGILRYLSVFTDEIQFLQAGANRAGLPLEIVCEGLDCSALEIGLREPVVLLKGPLLVGLGIPDEDLFR
mgnify:CR=1 FL=1